MARTSVGTEANGAAGATARATGKTRRADARGAGPTGAGKHAAARSDAGAAHAAPLLVLPVLRAQVARGVRGLAAWSLAMVGVLGLYLPFYPTMSTPEMSAYMENLPQGMVEALNFDQIATGGGYTHAAFFNLMGYALLAIACVAWGAAAIGGAEEDGSLELTLAHGVSRTQYAVESFAAMALRVAVLSGVVVAAVMAMNGPAELAIDLGNLLAEVASLAALGLLAGAAALAGGAFSGRRGAGIVVGAGVAVYAYLADAVAAAITDLEWLADWSPLSWVFNPVPLVDGVNGAGLAGVFALVAAAAAVATFALRRRDVTG